MGYSDVDWVSDLDEWKSTTGYIFLLNNGAISWKSKNQTCIALSTMGTKFIVCLVAKEIVWLKRFLQSLGIVKDVFAPTIVYSESQVVIAYVKDPKYHGRAKHINAKNNFIRDIIAQIK